MVCQNIGKKEQILKLIKENDGLTYKTLETKYNNEFGANTFKKKSGYSLLKRLRKEGLITNDNTRNTLYRATAKAFSDKPDDLEFVKSLFEKDALKVYPNKVSKDDIERLKVL